MPPPPLSAPFLLIGAGSSILVGTQNPSLAGLAFGWGAPLCFLALNIVMFSRSLPSALLLSGSVTSLSASICASSGLASMPVCVSILELPSWLRPALAFSGPAILITRLGPNPSLLSWLGATAIGLFAAVASPEQTAHVLDDWRPGTASGLLTLLCSFFMFRARASSPSVTPPAEKSPLSGYACVWAVHAMLQLHAQSFLFPSGARLPLLLVILASALLPSRTTVAAAIVLRNAARIHQLPFVWDSEYWLALTDVSTLVSMYLCGASSMPTSGKGAKEGDGSATHLLPHIGVFVRYQLAILYAAAAFFKLNHAFLNPVTSCAPIFGLSLLERVPLIARLVEASPAVVGVISAVMPGSVVGMEALIAVLLALPAQAHRGVVLALIFHLFIAITPPPNGVPTFSCVAASRLILCVGDGAECAALALRKLIDSARASPAIIVSAIAVLIASRSHLDAAISLYLALAGFILLALLQVARRRASPVSQPSTPPAAMVRVYLVGLLSLAFTYGFLLPILGVQEIGSCTMFANMRLVQGGSNHVLGLPTGILQSLRAGDDPKRAFGGGVVRVESTSSAFLNHLYPGEITSLLDPGTRRMLKLAGHATRQFNPKARRILGHAIRTRMPFWDPRSGEPFVRYTVPAIELRRMLAEARRAAAESRTPFDLSYTRLVGAQGDEAWRVNSTGVVVELRGDDGDGHGQCLSRGDLRGSWSPCDPDELALLPEPPPWELKLSLYYPYAVVPGVGEGPVCNY